MIENFVKEYAKLLASYPHLIKIKKHMISKDYIEIFVFAHKEDAGKLIGKDGRMIQAIRTLISGCKAKNNTSYKIIVEVL